MEKIKGANFFRIWPWLESKGGSKFFLWDFTMVRRIEKATSFFLGIW
jgi:hypothetical protein